MIFRFIATFVACFFLLLIPSRTKTFLPREETVATDPDTEVERGLFKKWFTRRIAADGDFIFAIIHFHILITYFIASLAFAFTISRYFTKKRKNA